MKIGIRAKLAIAVAAIAVTVALLVFISMLFSFRAGFLQYVNTVRYDYLQSLKITIEDNIHNQDDWQTLTQNPLIWEMLLQRAFEQASPQTGKKKSHRPLPHKRPPKLNAFFLLNKQKQIIHGKACDRRRTMLLPIVNSEQEKIAYIGVYKSATFNRKADKAFVAKQTQTFFIIVIIAAIIGAVAAFFLAHWMVSPIQRLKHAMKRLTTHDYSTRVATPSKDEIGELMYSFNKLAVTLGEHEKSQQRWIADISHELRTPLATLRGEIEALQDGIRTLTPKRIDSLHEEIIHIQRIVDDLHQLALSDLGALRYQFAETDIGSIIQRIYHHNENTLNDKQLVFSLNTSDDLPLIQADGDRLHQLFNNLMQNSLRYTNINGKILVSIRRDADYMIIEWEDSAPGIAQDSHKQLFNRLYREESSRSRAQGGSGLGLSIAYAIVMAHEGRIVTSDSNLGGLKVTVTLPI